MSTPEAAIAALITPTSPFDDTSADIILRSSDGSDFRVYRAVLSLASPFFKGLLSLPQPDSEPEIPVIPVSEPSHLLDRFLRVWYPGAESIVKFESLDELSDIIALTLSKYDIQFISPILQQHLHRFLAVAHPVGVFSIACRYQWTELATSAAKESLKLPLNSLFVCDASPHLKHIPADLYQSLFAYHRKCSTAAVLAGALLPLSNVNWVWIKCNACVGHFQECDVPGLGRRIPRAWIFEYVQRMQTILNQVPGTDLKNPSFMATALQKAAACNGLCRSAGPADLASFIHNKYIPAITAAIDAVSILIALSRMLP